MAQRIRGTWSGYSFTGPGGLHLCMATGIRCRASAVLEPDGTVTLVEPDGAESRGHVPIGPAGSRPDCLPSSREVEAKVGGSRAQFRRAASAACRGGSAALSPKFRLKTREAAHLLKGLVAVDLAQLRERFGGARGSYPLLRAIQTGRVRYERADPEEHWQTYNEIMEPVWRGGIGRADCEDLSAGVAAELMFNGVKARPFTYKAAPRLYHVVVKTDRWGFLDPSRAAGMEGDG